MVGNPPVGTFLPVYDLLHSDTHTHRPYSTKVNPKYSNNCISHSLCKLESWQNKEGKKKKNAGDCTLTSSVIPFNIWTQFGFSKHTLFTFQKHAQTYMKETYMHPQLDTLMIILWALNFQVLQSSFGRVGTFQFLLPNISGQFGIGPLGPFSKHILCYHLLPISFLNLSGNNINVKAIWYIAPVI